MSIPKTCALCGKEIPETQTYCSRACSAKGWKARNPFPGAGIRQKAKLEKDLNFHGRREAK